VGNLANGPGMNANGASLVVFFDDGNAVNDRDVALFQGNDSNFPEGFPGETDGWHAKLTNITYTGGTATASFHAADGQVFDDEAIVFTAAPNNGGTNPLIIVDDTTLWDAVSLPDAGRSRTPNGALYDIHQFAITDLFNGTSATYRVNLESANWNDCLALVVAVFDFGAGALSSDVIFQDGFSS
jgi:hypothetical protein